MAELQRSTSKPALVKNPSTGSFRKPGRRVAFEVPDNHRPSGLSDIDSHMDNLNNRSCHPCCFTFCVWSCLILFILIIIHLFVGISYLVFLQAGLPKINVRMLTITKLEIDNNTQKMDTVISLGLRVTNKNDKFEILYGPLFVDVASDEVPLGKNIIRGFSQKPHNVTDLEMTMRMDDANVDKYAVDDLKSDISAKEMVFDVYVGGKIGFTIGSLHMINVPFLSSCHQIKLIDVDFGRRPACDVKMFAFRPKSN